jgi:hypothetical protein
MLGFSIAFDFQRVGITSGDGHFCGENDGSDDFGVPCFQTAYLNQLYEETWVKRCEQQNQLNQLVLGDLR